LPVHEVQETSTVTLTIEKPQTTKQEDVILLKDGEELKPSDHVKVTPTSPTTTEIQIVKVKPEDEGDYTVEVDGVEQPLVRLKVHPKPVIRQEIQLPKVQFNEKETLTIVCQFDGTPEEPFTFLHNDQPIVPDSRVTTAVEDNKYTIVVKDLRPEEDEGVYSLKSDHLILDTPSITVIAEETKPQTQTTTVEEEQVTITTVSEEQQPKVEEKETPKKELPVHEVEETSTVTLSIEKPQTAKPEDVILLKDGEELKPSDHVKVTPTSPTTTEIKIVKVKPEDEGDYTVEVEGVEQPLVRLKVHPKPVVRQEIELPKVQFNEKETLTIVCQFDGTPEEPFTFLHNDQPIVPDSRVTTTVEDNKYTIVVKDLRPEEDQGIYTLKSDHLILDTPLITVVPEEKKPETETTTSEEETVTVVTEEEQPETLVEEISPVPEQKKPEDESEVPTQEVPEGTTVTLTVEIPESRTHRIIILLKNKQPVKPSERIKITETSPTTVEIQIIKAKPQDEGKYSVVIDKKEQPIVQLKVIPKPVVHQKLDIPQTTFKEGETLTIICEFDSTPEEILEFLRNEKPLKPDNRISTIVEDNKYTIVVKDLRPKEDEGVYTLKSDHLILDTPSITIVPEEKKPKTETTTVEEETVTVVPEEEQPPAVVEEVEGVMEIPEKKEPEQEIEVPIQEVQEGTTVTLTVQIPEGTTHKIIILLKNKQPVKPSERIKITQTSPTTIEIQIMQAKPQDEGKYSVLIDKKEQPIIRLKVIPKPVVHQKMDIPQTTFKEGETLTIICEFDSTPEEPFTFQHNEQPIIPDSRVTTTVEDNKYTIVVKDLRPEEDEGVYTLRSDHLILDTPSITVVPEETKPQTQTTTVEEEQVTTTTVPEEQQSKIEEKETPKKELPVHEVEETSTVTLTIEKPQATKQEDVVLLKDGEELKPSDHVKMTPKSPTTTEIQIVKVKPEDEGDYTVEVEGVEQPLVRLKVHPKPVIRQEIQLPKVQFNEKETLTIVCQFDGTPEEPFTFLHNEQPIVPDSRVTTSVEDNKYTIVVKDLRPEEDEGVYSLKSDHLILDTPSITVVPEEKKPQTQTTTAEEEEVTFTTVPEEQQPKVEEKETPKKELPVHEVEETSTVTLTLEKPQTTKPEDVILLKDGQELHPSDHVKVTPTSPTTTEVQIIKVEPEDEGDYTVEVDGVEQPLVRLKVHPKPVIRQEIQLPKVQFNEKETLTIVCQFDGTPEEPFTFLHNEQPIVPDSRVTTTVEDNKYTIVVKDLRPEEDEGVYSLKSDHLILDTPSITVVPEEKKPKTEK
ncbi:unnamed protein product, partial [Rotaria sp. Silwood2]